MLKYFSSVVEKPIKSGGAKLIFDMQKIIKDFLTNEKKQYIEYSYENMRNSILHLVLPRPYAKYLIFGYIGTPFLAPPLVIAYFFMFWLIALKKRIAREKFYVIVIDLIEWQSTVWLEKKGARAHRFFTLFQCLLERVLLSYVADEVISIVDPGFLVKYYGIKKVHDLEFQDHLVYSETPSKNKPRSLSVLYAGDVGQGRGFDVELLEDILTNLNDAYKLLLVTYESERARAVEKKFRKFQSFCFLGQLEAEELEAIAKECQFALILYSPKYLYHNIFTLTKLCFYIANGLTVISTNLKRTKELNDKYNFGYVLDREEMLQLIKDLSPEKIKKNKTLEKQITNGEFLYKTLSKLDFS